VTSARRTRSEHPSGGPTPFVHLDVTQNREPGAGATEAGSTVIRNVAAVELRWGREGFEEMHR
jgi:hypothetical protein